MLQNSIHIWITDIDEIVDPYLLDIYLALLSVDEVSRYERFRFDKDKKQFLVSHALVRSVLANYVEIAAKDLQFVRLESGKPEVVNEDGEYLPVKFNLSHSGRYAVVIVTNDIDCGVDIEMIDQNRSIMDIAENCFSCSEMIDLQSKDGAEQKKRFYTYWTLKEAYIKARGETLASALNKISFDLHHQNQIYADFSKLSSDEFILESKKGWQFDTQFINDEYALSVALHHESKLDIKIDMFETIPMQV